MIANESGRWAVKLASLSASTKPQTLSVIGSTKREIQNVLIAEVWLCSGQSNMEMGIGAAKDGVKEILAATFPDIRLLMMPKLWKPEPQNDQTGNWKLCTPENLAEGAQPNVMNTAGMPRAHFERATFRNATSVRPRRELFSRV